MLDNNVHAPEHNGRVHNNHSYTSTTNYEVKSEEVQEIISKMPHWIILHGTTGLFAIISLLFAGAYFLRYPDVISTTVNVTSANPPVKIVAESNGRIQKIFVQDNQEVKKEATLFLLENPASYNDMLLLKNIITRLDTTLFLKQTVRTVPFARSLRLGELQPGYADLCQSVQQYLFFEEKNFISQKVNQLQAQVEYQSELNKELRSRDILLKEQLLLEKKKFEADSFLLKEKVIARLEYDNSKKELLNKQINADATTSGILQSNLQQTEYLRTITNLQQQKLQEENDLQQQIRENVKKLQGLCEIWEQKYLVKAPANGKVVFFHTWKEKEYITGGEAVLMIVPPVQNHMARASLRVDGAGKVRAGQKVLISLAAYPPEEFGLIEGKVANISAVALDTAYSLEITLVNGLSTTANRKIPMQPQLSGVAEVLTDDKNILQRLFEKLWIGRELSP